MVYAEVGGEYADPSMRLVLIPTDTVTEEGLHGLEGGVKALIEGDSCTVVEDGESMTAIAPEGSCFELHVGTGDDSSYTIDTTGMSGLAVFAQHVPIEFERDQHYLKDSSGTDIEPVAQEGAGEHDHGSHGDHGDEHGEHEGAMCHNTTTHHESTEEECEPQATCEWARSTTKQPATTPLRTRTTSPPRKSARPQATFGWARNTTICSCLKSMQITWPTLYLSQQRWFVMTSALIQLTHHTKTRLIVRLQISCGLLLRRETILTGMRTTRLVMQ